MAHACSSLFFLFLSLSLSFFQSLFGISPCSLSLHTLFFAPFKRQTLLCHLSLFPQWLFYSQEKSVREERFWVVPNGTCALLPFPPFPCFFNRNKHHTLNAHTSRLFLNVTPCNLEGGQWKNQSFDDLASPSVKINDLGSSWTLSVEVRFVYVSPSSSSSYSPFSIYL